MKISFRLGAAAAALAAAGLVQAGEVALFKEQHFRGDAVTLRHDHGNLAGAGMSDRVKSIEVFSGRWEFCSQPNFRGDCRVLSRGRYPELDYTLDSISSVREVTHLAGVPERRGEPLPEREAWREWSDDRREWREWREDRREWREDRREWRPHHGAVELFAGPDFRGRVLRLDRDAWDLDRHAFENRASSLVIHEGRWLACTRPGYEGRCRVLEPGSYRELGRLDDRIASLRRVG